MPASCDGHPNNIVTLQPGGRYVAVENRPLDATCYKLDSGWVWQGELGEQQGDDMKRWGTELKVGLAFASLLLAAIPALAHHSFGAEYDGNKPVTLTGVVTNVQWTNPHFYFFIDVKGQNGEVANWKFEGYPPTVLNRIGWKRDETMRPGDTVTVFGWRARDGSNWAHSREVTFAKTGKKLQSGPPAGNGDGGSTPPVAGP